MTKDEALTMCLEYIETNKHERKYVRHAIKAALEQFEPCIGKDPRCPCQDGDACHYKDCGGTKAWPVPQAEPVSCRFCHSKKGCWAWQCYHCGEIDDVQQPAAQPVQEPVALRDALAETLGGVFGCSRTWSAWEVGTMSQSDFYPAAESEELLDELVQAVAAATPPAAQRPWQGLTEDEKFEIAAAQHGWEDLLAAAEAKLKELNHG